MVYFYLILNGVLTVVDPVTQVALPSALVQEGDKGVDISAAGATADYCV